MRSEGPDLDIRYFREAIDPQAAERLVLRVPEGSIRVQPSEDDSIHLEFELSGNPARLSQWNPSIRHHETILIVTNDCPGEIYTVHTLLRIPPRIKDLEVHSMKGEAEIRDCPIDVLAISEFGGFHIHGARSVEASSVQGSITIQNSGSAIVHTLDGAVKCGGISGSLRIETQSGDIQVLRVKGNVVALSSGGDISVMKPQGRIRLITQSGDVELELTGSFGGGEVNTNSGDINLQLEHANVEFRAETLSGHINSPGTTVVSTAGPRRCTCKIGLGTKRLHVKSVLGDIEVE